MVTKRLNSVHVKYGALIASLLAGGMGYHSTHPIIHTINRAINTANKAEKVELKGNIGCVTVRLKGNI